MNSYQVCDQVRHHESDAAGNIKLPALLDYFQNVAAEHADILNVGMEDISGNGLIWVLSRLKLKIEHTPKLGEKLEIKTYPSGFARLFACRQYLICASGREAVYGGSDWLLINPATGRPVNPLKSLKSSLPENEDLPRYFGGMDKLAVCGGNDCGEYEVGMGDVDLNRHLNNAVYGRWIIDALGRLKPAVIPQIREIQINYLRAGAPGQRIRLNGSWEADGAFALSGSWDDGEIAFQACGIAGEVPFCPFGG